MEIEPDDRHFSVMMKADQSAFAQAQTDPIGATTGHAPYILAFGDSLTAGHGLRQAEGFPARLEARLAPIWPGTRVHNAGSSGDTTSGGLRRLPAVLSSLRDKPDLAIVELGANDVLRGIPPALTRSNLEQIIGLLERCQIPALLATVAPPPLLAALAAGYATIYQDVSMKHGVPMAPFFPSGVLGHPELVLPDRLHPNARAIDLCAEAMAPVVRALLAPRFAVAP